jgi:pentatricopeptide repeat protein
VKPFKPVQPDDGQSHSSGVSTIDILPPSPPSCPSFLRQVQPDRVSYRSVMNACIESGEGDHALKIFERMREDGLTWDTLTYNVVLKVRAIGAGEGMG